MAGMVAREVERLDLLLGRKEGDTESGRKNATMRVVKVAGRGRSRLKREEGAIECARIWDMIARSGGRTKRKHEIGEEQNVPKKRIMGE